MATELALKWIKAKGRLGSGIILIIKTHPNIQIRTTIALTGVIRDMVSQISKMHPFFVAAQEYGYRSEI